MNDPIRIGIIGVGSVADFHAKGYLEAAPRARIVAISDVNPQLLEARQAEWHVPRIYDDYHELLADPEIDAVSVCTPNALHHPITLAAAAAGKHVNCEKPISLSLEQGQEMIDACHDAGVILQVGHQYRSSGAAQKAKEIIDSGRLGRLTFVRLRQAHDWGGRAQVRGAFGLKSASGGGTLLDNGCHMMDLARYFGGTVRNVYGRMATLKFDIEVEDTSVVTLQFDSGALGSVENAWTATGWEEGFWLYGTEGALEYTNRYGVARLRHLFRDSPDTSWDTPDLAEYSFHGTVTHSRRMFHFLEALRGERPVICTGEDGLEAVRLVLASYRSAELDAPVDLRETVLAG